MNSLCKLGFDKVAIRRWTLETWPVAKRVNKDITAFVYHPMKAIRQLQLIGA